MLNLALCQLRMRNVNLPHCVGVAINCARAGVQEIAGDDVSSWPVFPTSSGAKPCARQVKVQ